MQIPTTRTRRLIALIALGLLSLPAPALRAAAAAEAPAETLPAPIVSRAAKIVAALQLEDSAQADRLTTIVARQYVDLSPIHDARDAALTAAKSLPDTAARDAATQQAHDRATAQLANQTAIFLGRLAAEISPAQIDAIKDGMTYGVLPKTFRVYQEMLPNMTPDQSRQLYAWLYEAREHAISAGSSDEKHGWFGKYKGRINNYLAHAGIDMKAAEKAMFDRKKAN